MKSAPLLLLLLLASVAFAYSPRSAAEAFAEPSFTTGIAQTTVERLVECGPRSRVSNVGTITADDGSVWTVPAATHFESGPRAEDLFNECGGRELASVAELDLETVTLHDVDGAEEFVAYVFADNYFELFVNGVLVAIDPVPFTPFNSNVVRFTARRPVTLAIMLVDWEENLGLGTERGRGGAFHPGDGGLVAHIKDADGETVAITDDTWRAQTFYTAPLHSRDCLVVTGQMGQVRDSSACSTADVADGTGFSAAHWTIPEDWMSGDFDASTWPLATVFTNETVGVDNKRAFTNFVDIFDDEDADAQFIWSSNLVLDNVVLLRKTIE